MKDPDIILNRAHELLNKKVVSIFNNKVGRVTILQSSFVPTISPKLYIHWEDGNSSWCSPFTVEEIKDAETNIVTLW